MAKILFVYPNIDGYTSIPIGISLLSGILKQYGHTTSLFDVTFMVPMLSHEAKEKSGQVIKVDVEKYWGTRTGFDIPTEFRKKIRDFKPDVISFSIIENNYKCARELIALARTESTALIIVGGIFPTTCPDFFIKDKNVDLICIGEGEYALTELAGRLDRHQDLTNIPNLIVKKDGVIYHNNLSQFYQWVPLIYQDWDLFDARHLYKPFMGKMRKTGYFELSRGCPFNCSYCVNKLCQELFKGLGKYHREKPILSAIEEIVFLKNRFNLELIFFNDENFLTITSERLRVFCQEFKEKVGLPFFIQSRADSLVDEKKVRMLKEAGCVTIAIGLETGNEELRTKLLNKKISNETFKKCFDNCRKYQIRTTVNVILGLPYETEENVLESIDFCNVINADTISVCIFAPYYGTKLRDICVKEGWMEDIYYDDISMVDHSMLNMPQLPKEKIRELFYNFEKIRQERK